MQNSSLLAPTSCWFRGGCRPLVFLLVALAYYREGACAQPAAPTPPLNLSPEGQRRAIERQRRLQVATGYADAHKRALSDCLNALNGTGKWLVELKAKDEAAKIIKQMEALDPEFSNLAELKKSVAALEKPEYLDEAHAKELATRTKSAARLRADRLLALARTCYEANLLGYAYDLVGEMLEADPDYQPAHLARGEGKLADGWHTPFVATRLNAAQTYVLGKGWVPSAAAERVAAGEWFEANKWMSIADADKLHSDSKNPWVVETDNFTLRSTDTRKQTIQVAERLEGIRQLCFRQFLEFFMRGSPKNGAQLLFNQSAPKKMLVYFFGTREAYVDFCTKDLKGGRNTTLLLQSAGFYDPAMHNCYFYHGDQPAQFMIPLMQHEVTHQVLGEFTKGGNAPTWLVEGIAGVLEYARYDAQRKLMLPSGADHLAVAYAIELLKTERLPAAGSIFNLTYETFHAGLQRRINYHVSGALCRFMLEMQHGAYAADFLEYLNDQYRGNAHASLNDYMGMDNAEIDRQFREYLKQAQAGAAKLPAAKKPVGANAAGALGKDSSWSFQTC